MRLLFYLNAALDTFGAAIVSWGLGIVITIEYRWEGDTTIYFLSYTIMFYATIAAGAALLHYYREKHHQDVEPIDPYKEDMGLYDAAWINSTKWIGQNH